MKPIKSLEGKRVALLGLGISQIDFVIGMENGMTVGVSPRSTVLDSCVNADERLYGYHR